MKTYKFILRIFFGVFVIMAVIFFFYAERKDQNGYQSIVQDECKGVLEQIIVDGRNRYFIVNGKRISLSWAGRILDTEATVGDSLIKYSGAETVELVKMKNEKVISRKTYDLR